MESMKQTDVKEDSMMGIISFIFFGFLSIVAVIGCFRSMKLLVRMVNRLFDKIDGKLG
jgi:hypothetical protein